MASTGPSLHVAVTLKDVNFRDPVPERSVVLEAPTWQVNIGRGTQSGYEGLTPAPNNAWFDSRVMSRSHAILRADPVTKELTVEDVGSMHGTHLVGRRLKAHDVEQIWEGDTLTLGADVTRGSSYFNALNITVTWKWSDQGSDIESRRPPTANMYRNSFSADYYSGDDAYEEVSSEILGDQEEDGYEIYEVEGHISDPDDDLQVIQDSARDPSVEIIMPPTRTFTVPESDDGSTREGSSPAELSDEDNDESPVSSPIIPGNANETETETVVKKSKIVTLSTCCSIAPGESASNPGQPDTSQPSAASSADVNEAEEYSDLDETSDANSYAEDEPDDGYLGSLRPSYIISFQDEFAEPTSDGPTSSLGATQHQEHVRPPSPSDAAMAKPLTYPRPVMAAAPPFYSFQSYGAPGVDMASPAVRSTSAWAGHNSVLHEPMPRHNLPALWSTAPYQTPHTAFSAYQAPSMAMSTQPLSPLSIASLVEQQSEKNSGLSRKRKADNISSDDSESRGASPEPASSEMGENIHEFPIKVTGSASLPAIVAMDDVTTTHASTLPSEPASTVEVAESVSSADIEPPRKKVKTVKAGGSGTSSNGFVKMAAATITGMAIGAVGTIIGLAALPQEYFV